MVVTLEVKLEFDDVVDVEALANNAAAVIERVLPGEYPYASPCKIEVAVEHIGSEFLA